MSQPNDPGIRHSQMRLLVMGCEEKDANYLCDLLKRIGNDDLSLDSARSSKEALTLLG